MKRKNLHLAIIAIVIAGATVITSCKKKTTTPDPTPTVDSDQAGSNASNTAESISSDMISIGSEGCDITSGSTLTQYRGENTSILSCAAVVRDTTLKTVTITFNGTQCIDGKVRSGSLVYNYSASTNGAKKYRHIGFSASVTANNYVVDGNAVTITNKTISNTTPQNFTPSITPMTWSITSNISIALAGGAGTVSWSCNRVKTLLNTATTYSNAGTPINWAMAKVGFTGSASGTRSNGETFTATIRTQLVKDFGGCNLGGRHPFISGELIYAPSGKSSRTIDYGDGTCNLNATVSIDGVVYQILL